jgi:PKD repeat protein
VENPVHSYTADGLYSVSLSVANSACQNNSVVKPNYITAGSKPKILANFVVSPISGNTPLTVKCTDKSVGNPSMLIYNFGDGVNISGLNPIHTYRLPGVYTISQSILKYNSTSNSFISSIETKKNVITVFQINPIQPIARFTASPITGNAPLTVTFFDKSTANPIFYNYNFGDGFNVTEPNPVHTYNVPGVYTVTLQIFQYDSTTGSMVSNSCIQTGLIIVNGT